MSTEAERHDRLVHVALVLSTIGLSLLVFLAYVFVFTGLQEARNQHSLLEQFFPGNKPAHALLVGQNLREGQAEALLTIPELGLHVVVLKGTSSTDLMNGPGVMDNTAAPGTKGNSVIAGRRTTAGAPFAHLMNLRPGEHITVATGLGHFTYDVTQVGTARPGSADPISPSHSAELTLITSNPPLLATGRIYVTAKLVTAPAVAPQPHSPPSLSQRGLSGDPSAILPTILWGLVFVGSLFVLIGAYRRWPGQLWAVYLMSTPIVLAIALLCFENFYRLLPATL
jgi:LPXTG-site transpeptidase (sortase) family protein